VEFHVEPVGLPTPDLPPTPVESRLSTQSLEVWITRIGVALFVIGCAFLFKYSIDQAWFGPAQRLVTGYVFGTILLGVGWKTVGPRPRYGDLLLGGGIATLQITSFAANVTFNIFPFELAFGVMSAVNMLALGLALSRDRGTLALVGTAGAFLAPFVLYNPDPSMNLLAAYLSVVVASAGAVYIFRRWTRLLIVSWVGYVAVIAILAVSAPSGLPISIGVLALVGALAFGLAPSAWPASQSGPLIGPLEQTAAVLSPLVALLVWYVAPAASVELVGGLAIASGVLLGAFGTWLRYVDRFIVGTTQRVAGLLVLNIGLGLVTDGFEFWVAVAIEAALLHAATSISRDRVMAFGGHLAAGCVALAWGFRVPTMVEVGEGTLEGIVVLVMGAVALVTPAHRLGDDPRAGTTRVAYELLFHTLVLAWVALCWSTSAALVLLAADAIWLHWRRREGADPFIAHAAHLLSIGLVLFSLPRLAEGLSGTVGAFDPLLDFATISGLAACAFLVRRRTPLLSALAGAYEGAAHLFVVCAVTCYVSPTAGYLALAADSLILHAVGRWRKDTVVTDLAYAATSALALCTVPQMLGSHLDVSAHLFYDASAIVAIIAVSRVFRSPVNERWAWAHPVFELVSRGLAVLWVNIYVGVDASYVAFSLAVVSLHYSARFGQIRIPTAWAHIVTSLLVCLVGSRVVGAIGDPGLGMDAFLDLGAWAAFAAIIGMAKLDIDEGSPILRRYAAFAHVLILAWAYRYFGTSIAGQALVSITWGLIAASELIYGYVARDEWVRRAGLATLLVLVGKLFLIDLSQVDVVLRILLFMGFGGAFLVLGFYLPKLEEKRTIRGR
jgi:hypothetical protein